jgi:hypothetical protein
VAGAERDAERMPVRLISFDFVVMFIKVMVDNIEFSDFFIGGDPCRAADRDLTVGAKRAAKTCGPDGSL